MGSYPFVNTCNVSICINPNGGTTKPFATAKIFPASLPDDMREQQQYKVISWCAEHVKLTELHTQALQVFNTSSMVHD